ncbi:ICE-like protease (caspase) p20 domain protein [Ceratobasidium sp. AG-Ba]|nr:ICE-like protease (caspase) p20 domain protein [Ceratobasidium sp. AG-Ba]
MPLPQTRTSEGPMPSLRDQPRLTLPDKRSRFIERFSSNDWNHPAEVYSDLSTTLIEVRALVVAIKYSAPAVVLPATYGDAWGIIDMLEHRFRYPSKCIRVLADQVNSKNRKDQRWPSKANIEEGIKWLTQDSAPGCRRFLFFAGHGYSRQFVVNGNDCTEEGLLPRDHQTLETFNSRFDSNPEVVVDRETVVLDTDLNRCLAEGLADGAKLTVMFDCCYSGGLSGNDDDPNLM